MRRTAFDLPDDKRKLLERAVKLEWLTVGFFATATTAMYLALGSSQAMKAAWIEDMLAFIPPIAWLIANRLRKKAPNDEYPYGYHRVVAIGFLTSAVALLLFGVFLLYESVMKLIAFEHPPIGLVQPFGDPIWLGWIMIVALAYTMFPAVILGRMKLPLARELHDRILYADAEMNRADYLTAGAAIVGVIGIRFGLWWADAAAAIFISFDIVRDGAKTLRTAVGELMDKRPRSVDDSRADPLPARVETELKSMSWVKDAKVRFREEGHVFYGEALVIPRGGTDLPKEIEKATSYLQALDWRLYDIVISPVLTLEQPQEHPTGA